MISHRVAELALTPGIIAQDGFLTTHLIESLLVPERELIAEYLGQPDDVIETPTPAQTIIYGETRRRIPVLWDVDNPVMAGLVQNQDSYMQSVAAQRPFFFDHVQELTERAFEEYSALTGRHYAGDDLPGRRRGVPDRRPGQHGPIGRGGRRLPPRDPRAQGRRGRHDHVPAVPERPDRHHAPREEGRDRARAARPAAGRRPAADARDPRDGEQVPGERRDPKNAPYPELATYGALRDAPPLYSGSFGMGSRDLQPEGLVGAVENMLDGGAQKKLFYLSIDFVRDQAITPKQEMYQQTIEESYPHVKELAVRGSENPNLMPKDSITVRFHSVGGWGAITTGKNLAMTLFDLLGYHIKANPKYGSEKKGQPTTYYLSAAPEPIQVNCEYFYVDVVLSPDPNVFGHTNALAGLKEGGVFIIQSDKPSPEAMWESIPPVYQQIISDKKIKVYYLDGFKIARDEATDSDLQLRMQGIAFQGAFFAVSPLMQQAGLTDEQLLEAIREQLQEKFGSKGTRVVDDNMRVVKRGFDEVREVVPGPITEPKVEGKRMDSSFR